MKVSVMQVFIYSNVQIQFLDFRQNDVSDLFWVWNWNGENCVLVQTEMTGIRRRSSTCVVRVNRPTKFIWSFEPCSMLTRWRTTVSLIWYEGWMLQCHSVSVTFPTRRSKAIHSNLHSFKHTDPAEFFAAAITSNISIHCQRWTGEWS